MAGKQDNGIGLPTAGMLLLGFLGAIISGASFEVIKYWPQPQSVAPVFGFWDGFAWGGVVGGISGLVIGFLTDESHFPDTKAQS